MDADLFGCGFHNVLFFLGQAVERIHQLVYLPLQATPDGARARSVRVNGLGKLAVFGPARSRSYAKCVL